MSIPAPDAARLSALSEHYGFALSEAEIAAFEPAVAAALSASEDVERLYLRSRPEPLVRAAEVPMDNPLGAWAVTTSITESAAGPLAGRTIAVKDNVMVGGVPMANGSASVAGFVPLRDATAVRRLLDAGATITGKATCEDLCFSGGSFTSKPGPVRNPWDPARNAGGSSSGCAALVANGDVDLALGGDQGGSVRMPAAYCGIVGHKPTHGLVPYTGAFPIETTLDHLGPMTRTVEDAAVMLGVLAGVDGFDPRQPTLIEPVDYAAELLKPATKMRVGVVREGFGTDVSEAGVDDTVRNAVETLRSAGLIVEDVSVPWHTDALAVWSVIGTEGGAYQMIDGNGYGLGAQGLYDPELIVHYAAGRIAHGADLSRTVQLVGLSGRYTFEIGGGKYYAMARNLAYELRAAYDHALSSYDALIMPTVPYTAKMLPPTDVSLADYLELAMTMVGNTAPFDVTGHPACSVPAGLFRGLPVGMMIVGRRFDDATVLRVAHTFERAVGGFPSPLRQINSSA